MGTRRVHAIRIALQAVGDRSVIVWLQNTEKLCVRLLNPRKNWLTVSAGDPVVLTRQGEQIRTAVESVELYRVFPASENGRLVESARDWLNEEK